MLYGIALIDHLPFRITCEASLVRGHGDILISGPIDPSIEETINATLGFAYELCSLGEGVFPDLSNHNLHIRIRLPASPAPIVGPSLGLLLSLELLLSLTRQRTSLSSYVTGAIDAEGNILPVGAIEEKRRGVRSLGGERLVLPSRQLDFFSTEVIQIPVSNIFEAYRVVIYGET